MTAISRYSGLTRVSIYFWRERFRNERLNGLFRKGVARLTSIQRQQPQAAKAGVIPILRNAPRGIARAYSPIGRRGASLPPMAYDEALAERVRATLAERDDVTERKMFGGIAFMAHGNMCCGVSGEDLMVRLGEVAPMPHSTSRAPPDGLHRSADEGLRLRRPRRHRKRRRPGRLGAAHARLRRHAAAEVV